MGCGRKVQEVVINIKASMFKIKNMDMGSFHGRQEMSIRATIKKT